MNLLLPAGGLLLLAVVPGLFAGGIPAPLMTTRTLTFEGSAAIGYAEGGYHLSAPPGEWVSLSSGAAATANNGSRYLRVGSSSAPLTLVHVDGQEFDLLDLDLAEYSTFAIPEGDVKFEGTKRDGSILHFNFNVDKIIDGSGPKQDFEKISFPPEWTGLTKVRLLASSVAIDNLRLRGLAVENNASLPVKLPVPLEIVSILEENAPYNRWSLQRVAGTRLDVTRDSLNNGDSARGFFDLATKQLGELQESGNASGWNPQSGERCTVASGALTYLSGNHPPQVLARTGENGVSGIAYPAVSNGKVIFTNHGYQGREAYAVFMASTTGVVPVLTPQTVLADGGTPHAYPYALHFSGNTFAIPTSTTKTGDCFVVSFNGGPLRISPGAGQKLPGSNTTIAYRGDLLWLDDSSIGYIVRSNGSATTDHLVVMNADGSTSSASWPANLAKTVIEGSGFLQRCYGEAGCDRKTGTKLVTGPLECLDLAPNNLQGLVALLPDGSSRVLMRMETKVPGFGTIKQIGSRSAAANGEFYATACNETGKVALLHGRIPETPPALKLGEFVPTTDGTMRFVVENLTHGRSYRVESGASPAGPWSERSRFIGGAPSRTALGALQKSSREFFRVVPE